MNYWEQRDLIWEKVEDLNRAMEAGMENGFSFYVYTERQEKNANTYAHIDVEVKEVLF